MRFIRFNLTKINAERLSENTENLKVNTSIDILNIDSINKINEQDQDILKVGFNYSISYDPGFAKISFSGEVFISEKSDLTEDILSNWKKDKSFSEDFRLFLFNIILMKCNLKALQFEEELNIPLHIPLPLLKKTDLVKKE